MSANAATNSEVELRDQLGGRRLLSKTTWSIGTIVAMLVVLSEALNNKGMKGFYLCVVASLALLCTALFQWLLHKNAERRQLEIPHAWSFIYLVAVGTSIFLFLPVFIFVELASIRSYSFTLPQLPLALASGTIWTLVVVVVLDIRDRESSQMLLRIQSEARQDIIGLQQNEIVKEINRQVAVEIESGLAEGRAELEHLRMQLEDIEGSFDSMSSKVREISVNAVRTLSHRLRTPDADNVVAPGLFQLVKTTVKTEPFRTLDLAVIIFLTFIVTEIRRFGFVRGAGLLAIGVLVLICICELANKLMRSLPSAHLFIFSTAFVLLQVNTVATDLVRSRWGARAITFPNLALEIVFSAILIFLSSAFPIWRRQHLGSIAIIRNSLDERSAQVAMRNSYLSLVTQEAAQVLHGSVQSRLQACAMSIDVAVNEKDLNAIRRALDEAWSALVRPISGAKLESDEPSQSHLGTLVERKVDLWKDLVNINWKVEPSSSEVDRSIAIAAGEVIEEAMGNAIRHGKATVIDIEVVVTEPAIKITVTDNGRPDEDGSARLIGGGTGLSMVDIRSSGKWSIERRDESTVLQAMLTMPPSLGLNP